MTLTPLPDGVTRARAITVLKFLATGKNTRLTAELSGETKAVVAALLDLCPDPSPRGIRAVVRQLEDGTHARPEPIRGPIPPLTPATPRYVTSGQKTTPDMTALAAKHGTAHPGEVLTATQVNEAIDLEAAAAEAEPEPQVYVGVTLPEPSAADEVVGQLAGDYIAELETSLLPGLGLALSVDLLPGPHAQALAAMAELPPAPQAWPEGSSPHGFAPAAVDDVDRLVERVQQHRPALAGDDPGPEGGWDGLCGVCGRPVKPEWAARTRERVHFTHALLAARREASG